MFSLEAYPKFVYRPIGRFVVSGRGRRWSLSLGRLLVPSSRARLSSFRLAVRFARAHGTRFDCAPPLTIPNNAIAEASASVVLLLLSPSAVRSHRAIKREEPRTSGRLRDSSNFDEVSSHRYVVSCTASIDTAAKFGNNSHTCKCRFANRSTKTIPNKIYKLYNLFIIK